MIHQFEEKIYSQFEIYTDISDGKNTMNIAGYPIHKYMQRRAEKKYY